MSSRFLRHRSQRTREAAVRNLEMAVQRVANLVLNASALADRMEATPSRDVDEVRDRRARVKVLRDAARVGRDAIERWTAELAGDQDGEVDLDQRFRSGPSASGR